MGAYAVSLNHPCGDCRAPATKEVFNARNASLGYFCDRCAERLVRKLNEEGRKK